MEHRWPHPYTTYGGYDHGWHVASNLLRLLSDAFRDLADHLQHHEQLSLPIVLGGVADSKKNEDAFVSDITLLKASHKLHATFFEAFTVSQDYEVKSDTGVSAPPLGVLALPFSDGTSRGYLDLCGAKGREFINHLCLEENEYFKAACFVGKHQFLLSLFSRSLSVTAATKIRAYNDLVAGSHTLCAEIIAALIPYGVSSKHSLLISSIGRWFGGTAIHLTHICEICFASATSVSGFQSFLYIEKLWDEFKREMLWILASEEGDIDEGDIDGSGTLEVASHGDQETANRVRQWLSTNQIHPPSLLHHHSTVQLPEEDGTNDGWRTASDQNVVRLIDCCSDVYEDLTVMGEYYHHMKEILNRQGTQSTLTAIEYAALVHRSHVAVARMMKMCSNLGRHHCEDYHEKKTNEIFAPFM